MKGFAVPGMSVACLYSVERQGTIFTYSITDIHIKWQPLYTAHSQVITSQMICSVCTTSFLDRIPHLERIWCEEAKCRKMKIGSQWTSKRIVGVSAVEWFKPGCLGLIPDDCLLFHFSLSHILVTRLSSLCKLKAMGSWAGKLEAGQGLGRRLLLWFKYVFSIHGYTWTMSTPTSHVQWRVRVRVRARFNDVEVVQA